MAIPDYAVKTKFTAKDEVTPAYKRMENAAESFNRKATKGAKDTSSALRNVTKEGYKFGTVVKGILAADAIRGGINLVRNGIQGAATDFIDFDDAIVGAAARFDDIGVKSKNARVEIARLKQGAIDSIRGTEHSAVSAGKAMDFFAKANWSSDAALKSLRPMLDLSTAAGEEFSATVDMTNDLLGAFQMRSEDSSKQIEHLARMTDVLTRSGLDANGGLIDFFETMKMVGPVAKSVGAGLEDVSAMQVILANAGIKGSQAATALKRALINIPSERLKAKFEGVGIAIEDSAGNIRPYINILADINEYQKRMGNRSKINMSEDIFGMYGIAGGLNLMEGLDDVIKELDRLFKSGGVTKEVADFRREHSLNIKLMIAKNALLEKSFQFLDDFKYQSMTGLDAFVKMINDTDIKPFVEGVKTSLIVLKEMWSVIRPFAPYLPLIAQGFLAWKAAAAALFVGNMLSNGISAIIRLNGVLTILNFQLTGVVLSFGTVAAAAAAAFAIVSAGYSLFTGKDNMISRAGQWAGLLPRLTTDSNGVVTGWAPDSQQSALVRSYMGIGSALSNMQFPSTDTIAAPNTREAQNRQQSNNFYGRLDISAPPGSTFTQPQSAPGFNVNMLGAN